MAVSPTFRSEGSHPSVPQVTASRLVISDKGSKELEIITAGKISTKNIRNEIIKRHVCFAGFRVARSREPEREMPAKWDTPKKVVSEEVATFDVVL